MLQRLIRRRTVIEMRAVLAVLDTRSRMTAFRRLKDAGALTSFTHSGRYYTLVDMADFDHLGLWFCGEVGFSRAGTLKETIAFHVQHTGDGWTHRELFDVLRVRVHNTLLDLVRVGRIGRESFRGVHLYVSADPKRAAEQLAARQEVAHVLAEVFRVLSDEETVEILVEALRAAPVVPHPARVAESEALRGRQLTARHVEQVYERYGLVPGKKTPGSTPSRH
jgi:hypothetical protein